MEAAFSVGLTEAEFWDQTPYLTHLAIRSRGRRAIEMATAHGWMSERFAREPRLSRLSHYLEDREEEVADAGDALIASFAMMHGLGVDEASDAE